MDAIDQIPPSKLPGFYEAVRTLDTFTKGGMEAIRGELLGQPHPWYPDLRCVHVVKRGYGRRGSIVVEVMYWGIRPPFDPRLSVGPRETVR